MDGKLGPYAVEPRLRRADTVNILDTSLLRCAWRAARRGRERLDFWTWTIRWRRVSRPQLLNAVADFAPKQRSSHFAPPPGLGMAGAGSPVIGAQT